MGGRGLERARAGPLVFLAGRCGALRWKNETGEFGDTFSERKKKVSKETGGQKWHRYSPEFKRQAVDRIVGGESPTAVARELGIRRKFLYAWKAEGKGSQATPPVAKVHKQEVSEREVERLQKRIEDLERLAGRQTAELDFFAAALRSVKGRRPKSGASSDGGSTK